MTPLPIRHNSSSKRTVFRKKVDISNKSTIKVLLEALLMLTIGSSLLLVVNSIPNKIRLTEDIMDSGTKTLFVIAETADILVVIGTVLLIITIIICGLILILGAIVRSLRVIQYLRSRKRTRRL